MGSALSRAVTGTEAEPTPSRTPAAGAALMRTVRVSVIAPFASRLTSLGLSAPISNHAFDAPFHVACNAPSRCDSSIRPAERLRIVRVATWPTCGLLLSPMERYDPCKQVP